MVLTALASVSAGAFLYYGITCLVSPRIIGEFERYGVPHLRIPSGALQLLGAGGVIFGLRWHSLGAAAAAGLCLMMVLGLETRRRLQDAWVQRVPALVLAGLNAVLVVVFLAN